MTFMLRPLHIALQPDDTIHYLNARGQVEAIRPEHPKYHEYRESIQESSPFWTRLVGTAMILPGIAAWWYPWQVLLSGGASPRRMAILGPFLVGTGLTLLLWPKAVYQVDVDSWRRRRIADCAKIVFVLLLCALNLYLTELYR